MATTFINGIEVRPGRTQLQTAKDSIEYITNPEKTDGGRLVTGFRCSPEKAYFEIMMNQHEFEQKTGRKVIYHYKSGKKSYMLMTMRQSFKEGEVTPEQAHEIGCELAKRFIGNKYQYIVATHVNTHCIHNHITFNIVGSDFRKFAQDEYTPKRLRACSDKLCKEYELSVVASSPEWQKRKYTNEKQTPFRTIIKSDIDKAIEAAQSYEEFLKLMQENYYVADNGSFIKFRHRTNGQQKPIRSYTLKKGYTRNDILMRIEVDEELIDPLTFSQKLRNIEAMIHAAGYIREHGADFDNQSKKLVEAMSQTQTMMDAMKKKLIEAEGTMKCFDALNQFRPVYDQYRSGLLTERDIQQHKNEIDLYLAAYQKLKENNIQPGSAAQKNFETELVRIQTLAVQLKTKYCEVKNQFERLQEVQRVSEHVIAGDKIISERKGEKLYGR
jgi:Relaxase/Mobilisation nuclease domain.